MYSWHIIKRTNVCVQLDEFWKMYILCNHHPVKIWKFTLPQKIPSCWFAVHPVSFYLPLITQPSGLSCLIVQDGYCPALWGAVYSWVPAHGTFWGCLVYSLCGHVLQLCEWLMNAHFLRKYSSSADRINAPLALSLFCWNCCYQLWSF